MLRFAARVTVHKKNEEDNRREIDFPHTEQDVLRFKEEMYFHLDNVHFVDNDGNVYVLSINNIEVLP